MHWLEFTRIAALTAYVSCAGLLLIISIARRMQVRYVLYVSRGWLPTRTILAVAATSLPLVAILVLPAFAAVNSSALVAGYIAGSMSWLGASYLNDAVLVTRYGLVLPTTSFPGRLGWSQIYDSFVCKRLASTRIVVIWRDEGGKFRRLELSVRRQTARKIEKAIETNGTMRERQDVLRELKPV